MAWAGLGATLLANYILYRRGKLTMCSATRAVIPEAVFVIAFRLGSDALEAHVRNGYRA